MKKKPSVQKRDMAQRMLIERRGAGAGKHHTRERDVAKGIRRKGKHPEKVHENPLGWGDYKAAIPIVSGIAYVPKKENGLSRRRRAGRSTGKPVRVPKSWVDAVMAVVRRPLEEGKTARYDVHLPFDDPSLPAFMHEHGVITYITVLVEAAPFLLLPEPDGTMLEAFGYFTAHPTDTVVIAKYAPNLEEAVAHELVHVLQHIGRRILHKQGRTAASFGLRRRSDAHDLTRVPASWTPGSKTEFEAYVKGFFEHAQVFVNDLYAVIERAWRAGHEPTTAAERRRAVWEATKDHIDHHMLVYRDHVPDERTWVHLIKKVYTAVNDHIEQKELASPLHAASMRPSSRPLAANPTDLAGRHIPERYLAGLPPELQKQRILELTQSRDAYKRGDYSELPTDRAARKMGLVKQSKYTTEAKKRGIEYRGDLHDMAQRVMKFYGHRASAREVEAFAEALKKSFSKGLAAWKSGGHRPGATAQNWAVARVNSLVVGGKTSWTADKKLFEVLPAEVRAKIEAMRMKQNPIKVMVEGQPPADVLSGKHTRFYQSRAALDRIEEQGREVIPAITFRIEWGYKLHQDARQRGGIRFEKGERGVVTLVVDATRTQTLADEAERRRLDAPPLLQQVRSGRVTLYTAHTILHRLGDQIMPAIANLSLMEFRYEPNIARGVAAGLVVTDRVERAWRQLAKALWSGVNHFGGRFGAFERWLPTVVDTKACREGWITDSLQAMAETVPYRLLYKRGREQGVKLLSDLPFVPALEAALTEYIDASMDMLKGYQVEI